MVYWGGIEAEPGSPSIPPLGASIIAREVGEFLLFVNILRFASN